MSKKCKSCDNLIDERYEYCIPCINKIKQGNQNEGLLKVITQINWNLGAMQKWVKLFLLNHLEETTNKTTIQKNIHSLLLKDVEKDFKQLKQIKEEEER